MKEWKINQMIYHDRHVLNSLISNEDVEFDDSIHFEKLIIEEDKIVERALEYPVKDYEDAALYYPGKAYAIALMVAKFLEKEFNEDFYEVLNDPDLLYGNDRYFKTYSEDRETYDKIIKDFNFYPDNSSINYKLTMRYIKDEFGNQ